ncbi:hypothetical protein CDAR_428711 [Caerostris darwini]|uniref:Uncharacterized protein n=1 Tax=Caerostris darwini TaxID=1538125 RepID=A0AAV4TG17_9ARAC|nr:hypothetical protein CDAR_428711 [Caerostris darwini]
MDCKKFIGEVGFFHQESSDLFPKAQLFGGVDIGKGEKVRTKSKCRIVRRTQLLNLALSFATDQFIGITCQQQSGRNLFCLPSFLYLLIRSPFLLPKDRLLPFPILFPSSTYWYFLKWNSTFCCPTMHPL